MAKVPDIYKAATVESLVAQPHIHPGQILAVEKIKADPDQSFCFIGDFGTGKTHFFYSLFNHAAKSYRRVYGNTLKALVMEYQQAISRSMAGEIGVQLSITAEELRQSSQRYSIFLDDIDKAKPTEYVAELIFDLLDSAVNFRHQVVWTSNLNPVELAEHFERADKRFGGAIVRRLLTATEIVDMW